MSLRDRKQLACAISFRDVSLSIESSPITDEYAARHSHAHCVFLVYSIIVTIDLHWDDDATIYCYMCNRAS